MTIVASFSIHNSSFVPQRHHRIDPCRSTRRDIARQERHAYKQKGYSDEGSRIVRLYAIEQTCQEPRQDESANQTPDDANKCEEQSLREDQPERIALSRAKRHADPDLVGTLSDRVGDDAV